MKKEKLLYLESLRGFAALIVALYHGNLMFSDSFLEIPLINHGYVMVDFFFVLSGFVIAYNYADCILKWRDVMTFQTKRFLRLYPLHIITFFVFVGIESAKYIFETRAGIVANNPAFSQNDWSAVFGNLFLTHSFTENDMTFNDPSWSISAEFYTYLLFAVVFLIIQKPLFRFIGSMIIIGLSCTLLIHYDGFTATTGMAIIRCFYGFFLGVCVCLLIRAYAKKCPSFFGFIGLFALGVGISFVDVLYSGFYAPLFAIVIAMFYISKTTFIHELLNLRPFVYLGTVSYGLYMWHVAVWWVINNGMKYGLKIPTEYNTDRGQSFLILNDTQSMGIIIVGLTTTFILASISYHFLEKPINNLRHRIAT